MKKGQSLPNLAKVYYLADQLGVSVGMLADSQYLSSRYKELKYLILRTPTYLLEDRLSQREHWFDEIYENYYYDLPESEQLIMDCLQDLIQKIQDLPKMPVICLLDWKYYLFYEYDQVTTGKFHRKAVMFVEATQEKGLKERLEME